MSLDFDKGQGLVPAIVQEDGTGVVLMLGFMNEEAVRRTRETGRVTFFSRSRKRLWTKGETSGHTLRLIDMQVDCDNDTLLITARRHGPTCHTGSATCFGEPARPATASVGAGQRPDSDSAAVIDRLSQTIAERRRNPQPESYTTQLFEAGRGRMARKVGEEATEVIVEALDGSNERLVEESADLVFHLLVLLEARGSSWSAVLETLRNRQGARDQQGNRARTG